MKNILVLFLLITSFTNTYACKCLMVSFEESIISSDLIFSGKLIAINKTDTTINYTFLVDKIWKGDEVKQTIIYSRGGCKYPFQIQEDYLVYSNRFFTSRCTRNVPLKFALDIDYLDMKFGKTNLTLEQKQSNNLTNNELNTLNALLDISKVEEKIDFQNPETSIVLLDSRNKINLIKPKDLVGEPITIYHLRFSYFAFAPKTQMKLTQYKQKGILVFGSLSSESLTDKLKRKIARKLAVVLKT